jgi:hypothetical protein
MEPTHSSTGENSIVIIARSRYSPLDAKSIFLANYSGLLAEKKEECTIEASPGNRGFWAETFLLTISSNATGVADTETLSANRKKYFLKIIPPHFPDLQQVKDSLLILASLANLSDELRLIVPTVYANDNGLFSSSFYDFYLLFFVMLIVAN